MRTEKIMMVIAIWLLSSCAIAQSSIDKIVDELEKKGVDVNYVAKRDPKTKQVYLQTKTLSFYSKEGKGFFEGSYDSRYLIAEYSLSVAYDLKTGMAICSYKEGRVYRGEVNNSDNLIGFVNDGKIYSKNGAGFFEGSFDSSEIIGYIANGVVYDKYGAGFFAGSFDSNHIVGYYEGDELGAAAAAIVLLLS